jgi:hypothetical protein
MVDTSAGRSSLITALAKLSGHDVVNAPGAPGQVRLSVT